MLEFENNDSVYNRVYHLFDLLDHKLVRPVLAQQNLLSIEIKR
jgi:hypothetical protein